MPAITTNKSFPQPPNPSMKIWRYMDFTKFVATLETSSLYFARADQLGDPFEGSLPKRHVKRRRAALKRSAIGAQVESVITGIAQRVCMWTYVNCWHANESESAAMWKLYAMSNEAIAIQTRYETLARCLPDRGDLGDLFVGEVKYLDYETETFEVHNSYDPFMHKRKSFEHEKEVRAVFHPGLPNPSKLPPQEPGRHVEVDLKILVEQVRIAPSAATWFLELVRTVCERYGHNWIVQRSSLDTDPIY